MSDQEKPLNEEFQWHDSPLENEEDDLLDRVGFAHLIADALLKTNPKHANVIGLIGGWGTGKSTVANFVVKRIEELNKEKINQGVKEATIIHFEPWMISSTEALVKEFFIELGKALLPKDKSQDSVEKRKKFYKYAAKSFEVLGVIAEAVDYVSAPIGKPTKFAANKIKSSLDIAAESLEESFTQPSLRESKETVCRLLESENKTVIVIIDDIDRLTSEEIQTVFKLIKACADFPRVSYLLLYDREQVCHALKDIVHNTEYYLEKVVSQVFDLPELTYTQHKAFVINNVNLLGYNEQLFGSQKKRLSEVIEDVLLPGLKTYRQAKRFFNTVNKLLYSVTYNGILSVDLADFLTLEYIRQYAPDIYNVILTLRKSISNIITEFNNSDNFNNTLDKAIKDSNHDNQLIEVLHKSVKCLTSQELFFSSDLERRFMTIVWQYAYLGFNYKRVPFNDRKWHDFLTHFDNTDTLYSFISSFINSHDSIDMFAFLIRLQSLEYDKLQILFITAITCLDNYFQESSKPLKDIDLRNYYSYLRDIPTSCLHIAHKHHKLIDFLLNAHNQLVDSYVLFDLSHSIERSLDFKTVSTDKEILYYKSFVTDSFKRFIYNDNFYYNIHSYKGFYSMLKFYLTAEEFNAWHNTVFANHEILLDFLNNAHSFISKQYEKYFTNLDSLFYKYIEQVDKTRLNKHGLLVRNRLLKNLG